MTQANVYDKLNELGIELPTAGAPAAAYVMSSQSGNTVYLSGHIAKKDGKVWAVVQQTMANSGAKPSSIDRAGWSDDGTLVLKQHQVGSDVQTLDDDAAAKLHRQAMDILSLATNGKNK